MNTAIPTRPYGPDAIPLSVIGFGGIIVTNADPADAAASVSRAVEAGVNYFDVAPQYGDAEQKLGPALEPYRDDCFLACKTLGRTAAQAREDFERSTQRLRTDHFDLYQLHGLTDMRKDVDVAFGRGGVIELIDELKRAGRIRHAGFSAHSVDAALAAMNRYDFDSILFPVNFNAFGPGEFGPTVLDEACRRGVSVLALKALAEGQWTEGDPLRQTYSKCWYRPLTERREIERALKFTLSRSGVVAAIPPGEQPLFDLALDVVGSPDFTAELTEEQQVELDRIARRRQPVFSAHG